MRTAIYVALMVSLVFNGLCVNSCMKAVQKGKEIQNQLDVARDLSLHKIAGYKQEIFEKNKDIERLVEAQAVLVKDMDILKEKYRTSLGNVSYWKGKFEGTGDVEDCRRLVGSLEFSLDLCNQENSANGSGWTLCEQKYTALESVVLFKDKIIDEHLAFQSEQEKAIQELQALLKAPRKVSLLNLLIPTVAFLLGVAVGG